jgi:hypothetical protein
VNKNNKIDYVHAELQDEYGSIFQKHKLNLSTLQLLSRLLFRIYLSLHIIIVYGFNKILIIL